VRRTFSNGELRHLATIELAGDGTARISIDGNCGLTTLETRYRSGRTVSTTYMVPTPGFIHVEKRFPIPTAGFLVSRIDKEVLAPGLMETLSSSDVGDAKDEALYSLTLSTNNDEVLTATAANGHPADLFEAIHRIYQREVAHLVNKHLEQVPWNENSPFEISPYNLDFRPEPEPP
jgi:hypothetical protein